MSDSEFWDSDSSDSALFDPEDYPELENSSAEKFQSVVRWEDLAAQQRKIVAQVQETIDLPEGALFEFLQQQRWSAPDFVDKYLQDPDQFLQGMSESGLASLEKVECRKLRFDCPICCEEVKEGVSLGCKHFVCRGCLTTYLSECVKSLRISRIKCPGSLECPHFVTRSLVESLGSQTLWDAYNRCSIEIYLKTRKDIRGCPASDCPYYIVFPGAAYQANSKDQVPVSDLPIGECKCGTTFCFLCGLGNHVPLTCAQAETWQSLVSDDSRTLLLTTENAKPCPKCNIIIEKQKGCYHMKCTCGHEFCWICLDKFVNYGHQCSRYNTEKETSTSKASKSKQAQTRFAHYSPRFASNIAAQEYHTSELSVPHDPSITNAHYTLREARSLLAWSFALLYFSSHSNQRFILEDNVVTLENAAEKLADLLRDEGSPDEVARLTALVSQRLKVLKDLAVTSKWTIDPAIYAYTGK